MVVVKAAWLANNVGEVEGHGRGLGGVSKDTWRINKGTWRDLVRGMLMIGIV